MNMGIRPILSALLRNSAGAILVSLQIAITLAIVVNAVYLTTQRVQLVGRPSGIDDQSIFSFNVEGFEKDFDFIGMVRDDMALLRQMPGVIDAAPIHQVPLSGSGSSSGRGTGSTGSGISMLTCCPAFTGWFAFAGRPSTRACPSLIKR